MDMASHDFDMARFLVGSEIDEVRSRGGVLWRHGWIPSSVPSQKLAFLRIKGLLKV